MPPLPLSTLLPALLPGLTRFGRSVVNVLVCYNGRAPAAADVASLVGLQSRYQLARQLRHDGLPTLEQLARWVRVLYWVFESEASGSSLHDLAHRTGLDSAFAYRLVRHTTGRCWSVVRRAGLSALMLWFRDRCRPVAAAQGLDVGIARNDLTLPLAVGASVIPTRAAMLGARAAIPVPRSPTIGAPRLAHPPGGILAARLKIPGKPYDVAFVRRTSAWVTRSHAAAISCIEIDPPRITSAIRAGCVPTRLAFDPSGQRAYVTNQFSEDIGIMDVRTQHQVARLAVGAHPLGILVSHDGLTLFVSNNLDQICALRLPEGRLVAQVAIPQACGHMALHPSGSRLYVSTWKIGQVLEIEAHTLHVLRRFPVGGFVQDIAIARDGRHLYAANEQGWLNVIDLPTGTVTAVRVAGPAFGVAITPDDVEVYVGLVTRGEVQVLRRASLDVRTVLETGGRPRRICFTPCGSAGLIANEAGWVDVVR